MSGGLDLDRLAADVLTAVQARSAGVKPSGGELRFICPCHDDHKPSARYHAGKRSWYCDPCGFGGGLYAGEHALAPLLLPAFDLEAYRLPDPKATRRNGHAKRKASEASAFDEPPDLGPAKSVDWSRFEAVYDWRDAEGVLRFRVARKADKSFPTFQPAAGGKRWHSKMTGVRPILYHADELAVLAPGSEVWVCEGEKDADNLRAAGFNATTFPGWCRNRWHEASGPLSGHHVIVVADHDDAGRAKGSEAAQAAHGAGATSVRVLDFATALGTDDQPAMLPAGFDASDFLAEHDPAEFRRLGRAAPEVPAPPTPRRAVETPGATRTLPHCPPGRFRLEDVGNGDRLVTLYGDRLLWCAPWSCWIVWDGKRWKVDDLAQAVDLAKRTATSIYAEAAAAAKATDKDLADATWKHAKASNAAARLRSMLFVTQPDVATLPDNLDPDPWLFTVENGTVDLRTGELRPHNRDDLITKLAPVRYDTAAKCPTWLAFLEEVMAGDADRISFLQRALGYSLTGDTREQVLLILYGTGSNGKTTFLTVCQELLGDYGRQTPAETLLDPHRDSGSIPNDLAALKGARMVISAETEDGRRLAEAKVKAITGGDRISARFMRAEWFEYTPEFKVWLATNHRPVIRGTDYAIWRRIRLVPFGVTIPDERQDKELPNRLRAELPGILAWAVEGGLAWQRHGLGTPEAVEAATSAYRDDMDVLGGFLHDCCIQAPRAEAGATDLYKAYCAWCEDGGGERAVSQRIFGSRLGERGFARERQRTGYVWRGIGLKVHDA